MDIKRIDKEIGETLLGLNEILNKKRQIQSDTSFDSIQKEQLISRLNFNVKYIY